MVRGVEHCQVVKLQLLVLEDLCRLLSVLSVVEIEIEIFYITVMIHIIVWSQRQGAVALS